MCGACAPQLRILAVQRLAQALNCAKHQVIRGILGLSYKLKTAVSPTKYYFALRLLIVLNELASTYVPTYVATEFSYLVCKSAQTASCACYVSQIISWKGSFRATALCLCDNHATKFTKWQFNLSNIGAV